MLADMFQNMEQQLELKNNWEGADSEISGLICTFWNVQWLICNICKLRELVWKFLEQQGLVYNILETEGLIFKSKNFKDRTVTSMKYRANLKLISYNLWCLIAVSQNI